MREPNEERGEVKLVLGDAEGIICAEMGKLAALSKAINAHTLQELYSRIYGAAPDVMYAVLGCLLIEGDADHLKKNIRKIEDFQTISVATILSLAAFVEDPGVKKALGAMANP